MSKRPGTGNRKSPPGRLRIVAGIWRSRLLEIADVPGLRPTSERIRETLFNWLAPMIGGARCLDLFAGTGALGLEALSRGAASAIFVDRSDRAIRTIRRNVETLDADGATVLMADAFDYLAGADRHAFEIVFLDPPFADEILGDLCRLIDERQIVVAGGLVYLEHDRSHELPVLPARWEVLKQKSAGGVSYSLMRTGE